MTPRRLIIHMIFALVALPAFSQSWEAIKGSDAFLWGEGWGTTVAEADKQALADLISKISLQVSGSTTHRESESVSLAGIEAESAFSSVVSTYSSATLTNTEKIIIDNEPDARVGRWIRRSDLARIFDGRKAKIADYISSALRAEEKGKIDVALKDLYWALALTKTLQDPNDYRYVDDDGNSHVALTWLPHRINEIFDLLKVYVTGRSGDDLQLWLTYRGKPVNSVDYTYFDGRDWSNICSAKDGIGLAELAPGACGDYIRLKIEYEYAGEAHIDREIRSVLDAIGTIPMRNAYISVKTDPVTPPAASTPTVDASPLTASFAAIPPTIYAMPEKLADNAAYRRVIDRLASDIVGKTYNLPDSLFTPEAKDIYDRLIRYGRAKIVGTPDYAFYRHGDNVIARGLQMSFSFRSGLRKSFVEDVTITFNSEGHISNITFGLGKTAEADILGKGVWSENARFAIMNFLENYQTAYALKRLDYISSIFDDDAVIITGTVISTPQRRLKGDLAPIAPSGDIIRYNRHTKDTYLRHLRRSFDSKEYINLRFAGNDVRKLGKGGELYAIQISQEYYSSNYGDKGYLFLMVDINDPENPIIKVRTWQPEKDPDFGIYGPEHFK